MKGLPPDEIITQIPHQPTLEGAFPCFQHILYVSVCIDIMYCEVYWKLVNGPEPATHC